MGYSPVFSTGFLYYTDSTPNEHYEVPPGFTAVLRDVQVYTGGGAATLYVAVRASAAAPFCNVIALGTLGVNTSAQWTGRVVVNEGGFIDIGVSSLGASDSAYLGGYLLRNVVA